MNLSALTSSLLTVTTLTLNACAGFTEHPSRDFDLTILHVNDHHSTLSPMDAQLNLLASDTGVRERVPVSLGGFPRLTAAMASLEAGHENVLKLHAGDAVTGTLYYTLTQGRADADLMNTVCFDAMAVGNHEFDEGDAGLRRFIDQLWTALHCRTPVLSANIVPRIGSPLGNNAVRPSVVLERGAQKIGIVGLTTAVKTRQSSRPDVGTRLLDEVMAAQTEIDALTRTGINKIVLLSHLGYAQEKAIAAKLSGVDVIVGGDSHSLLGDESLRRYGLSPVGDYPTVVRNKDGGTVCVVQAWQYSAVVGELRIRFDGEGAVKSCTGQPHILIGGDFGNRSPEAVAAIKADIDTQPALRITPPSAQAEAVLLPYTERVRAFGAEPVSATRQNLCLRRVPGTVRDSARSRLPGCNEDPHVLAHGGDVQQLVAEALLLQGRRFGGADISIQNGGGVRADLAAGTVTVADINTVLPFRNTLVLLIMSGAEVRAAIEDAMENVLNGNTGAYPYAGGLRWEVDLNQPHGARLKKVQWRDAEGQWKPLDLSGTYRVIANDFIADGRDGYMALGAIIGERRIETFHGYADALYRYARERPTVNRPPTDDFSTQVFIEKH